MAEPDDTTLSVDICVIGAGSGGLSVAAAAAAFGRQVVLIEKGKMGGDCLNYGCVPSKALIAAAHRAHVMRSCGRFGLDAVTPKVDFQGVHRHVQSVIAAIAPNDSVERFEGLGVRVIQAAGRFVDKATVAAGDYRITARRFVIATGSSPFVPPIPGLDDVPYFTNETIFDNQRAIGHLIVIGGGPIGIELAQAHLRLGAQVTVVEGMAALSKDDPEMASVVLKRLRDEGLEIREGVPVQQVEGAAGDIRVKIGEGDAAETISGTHLLVATGRRPNISELGLDAAGIKYERSGVRCRKGW